MGNFFKSIFKVISGLFKSKVKPVPVEIPAPIEPVIVSVPTTPSVPEVPEDLEVPDNPANDNIDPHKPDDGGDYTTYPADEEKLYYPKAIRSDLKLRTRGDYKYKYPQGAVVHFTAGRGRNKKEGGVKNAATHLEMGKRSIASEASNQAYAYFIIDRSGNVHQNFPLNRWGYHAGESSWKGLSGSVSDELVGIEIQSDGKLQGYFQDSENGTKYDCPEGKLAAWYTRTKSGDLLFDKVTESRYSENNANIQKGWYHIYTPEQEEALLELLIWMKRNNPDVFNLNYVLGHDEVAPTRKNDPGAALSMTMPEFRKKIDDEYKKRYPLK
jgi:N-acetyl-anhydromuramyl-L-alanine amidase AmpD